MITLPSQINSLFKYVHTSFRYVKSDPRVEAIFPFTIDYRTVIPCPETNIYWSNPTWRFLPSPTRPVNKPFVTSSSRLLHNFLHLSSISFEVSESSPSILKILKQSLLQYCSNWSHFLTRREDTVLKTFN